MQAKLAAACKALLQSLEILVGSVTLRHRFNKDVILAFNDALCKHPNNRVSSLTIINKLDAGLEWDCFPTPPLYRCG